MKKLIDELRETYRDRKVELVLMLVFVLATAGLGIRRYQSGQNAPAGPAAESTLPKETEFWTEAITEEAARSWQETERESETESETEADLYRDVIPRAPVRETDADAAWEQAQTELSVQEEPQFAAVPWALLADTTVEERLAFPMQTRTALRYLRALMPEGQEVRTAAAQLEEVLAGMVGQASGDWSVWVKNLKTGEVISIGDQAMKSASIMKLFILGTVYQAIENGELERTDTLVNLMKDMISYSDNEDSNRLLYLLGGEDYEVGISRVNAFIRDCGFSEMTIEYNGFNNSATIYDKKHYNQVSAADCGKLLETIYRREWGSRSISNEIEQMMINQHTRYKIPAGLPEGVVCGNKTGEMDLTENDAAIIYGDRCDYILVVLSSDWNSKDEAVSRIKQISARTYQYLEER